jgi:hypothetical protein
MTDAESKLLIELLEPMLNAISETDPAHQGSILSSVVHVLRHFAQTESDMGRTVRDPVRTRGGSGGPVTRSPSPRNLPEKLPLKVVVNHMEKLARECESHSLKNAGGAWKDNRAAVERPSLLAILKKILTQPL